jgi:outer membrane autotransporter protein
LLGQAIGYTSAANKAVANSYLFTDIGHPTDAAHLIYSQLDFSVIQSVGQQASMLFAPSYAVRQANSDIEPHLSSLALMRGANLNTDTRPLGDNQFWFSGGSNGFDSNSNQITPSFSSHTTTGTIGLDRMIASNALLGGAFSYSNGHSKFGSGSGEYDSHLSLGSLYATVSLSNNFYMNSTLQYGDIRQDRIYRTVFLGPTSITSIGKTSGSYEAIRIGFGHIDNYGSWSITPSVSISLAKTKLKAYSESETPVSLAYGDASYKSNFGTFAIAAQMNGSKDVWLPFFKMSIDRDRSNKPMTVGVGPDSSLIANISIDKPIRTFYTGNAGIQRIFDGGSLSIQGSATAGSALSNKGYGLSATYKLAI